MNKKRSTEIPPEMLIVWDEPRMQEETGHWIADVRNLRRRTCDRLFKHEMCSFISASVDEANVTFNKWYVEAWGAHQCWWFLREEICERVVVLLPHIEQHIEDALDRPWADDDDEDWDGGDGAWGRLGLVG